MSTTTIPWNDGSGDNIYVSAPSQTGTQTVSVSSDSNTGAARSQTVTFTAGLITQTLTVNQEAGAPQQYTVTLIPSSYNTADSVYASWTNQTRCYKDENSTTYTQFTFITGAQAESYIFYCFDTSSIPANATINSVSCVAKGNVSNAAINNITVREFQLCSGTTLKGDASSTLTTTAAQYSFSGGSWTRAELNDARIRFYVKRGNGNVNNNFNGRFYGATLTITYTA